MKEKKTIEAAIKSLETDIEQYNIVAEKENSLTLPTNANSWRVTVRQNKERLSSLENTLVKLCSSQANLSMQGRMQDFKKVSQNF